MPNVVGVVFHNGGKVYSYDSASFQLDHGELVVVPTQRGLEVGEVVAASHEIPREELTGPLKEVVRRLDDTDRQTLEANREIRREALATCRRLIAEHRLDMKLVDAEVLFSGDKILFTFFSEERVDFRALVSDLSRALKTRIELRQIGAREEARVAGGLGPCGRGLCCTLWQGDQEPVSIRMAKEQSLPLNPMKISGLCGRLMCCLKYEQQQYVSFRKEAPRCGTPVACGHGEGVVIGYQVPKDSLVVRMADGSIVSEPIGGCSCGGSPCRRSDLPEPALVPATGGEPSGTAGPLPAAGTVPSADAVPAAGAPGVGDQAGPAAAGCEIPPWDGVLTGITPREERARAESLDEGEPSGADGTDGEAPGANGESPTGEGEQPTGRRRSRPRRRRRRSGGGGGQAGPPSDS